MSELRKRLGRLPLERRVRFLELLRSEPGGTSVDRPTPRERGLTAPLSYSQNLLWFLDRLTPGLPAYNLVLAFWLRGEVQPEQLRAALGVVVARHETLRTSLREQDGAPIQVIEPHLEVPLPVTSMPGAEPAQRRQAARQRLAELVDRPFDFGEPPLWRAELCQVAENEYLFAFVVHHVVFDGASAEAFTGELLEAYRACTEGREPVLPELAVQYADFAIWQREVLSGAKLERLANFWQQRLRDAPVLEIPTDRPRPAEFSYRGARLECPVSRRTIESVHRFSVERSGTPYPIYAAVFFELLRRYVNQDDIVIGCSTSVRGRLEVQNLIGFFVNMLALRMDAGGNPTFRELVGRTESVLRESFAHIDMPFERVVQMVAPVRDPSRSPLVQVAFLMPQEPWGAQLPGLSVELEEPEATTSKFDMTWQLTESGEQSTLAVEYNTDLFDAQTVEAMMAHYVDLLDTALSEPDSILSEVDLLSPSERARLLADGVGPQLPVPAGTVHQLFAEQAARAPEAIAVCTGTEEISYGELQRRSDVLCALLSARGAGGGTRVALCLPRGIDYVTAVLGTLKCGAAFVPLDPGAPPDRIAALVADADPTVIVAHSDSEDQLPAERTALMLDTTHDAGAWHVADAGDGSAVVPGSPGDLAYVLYTSGSTGTPKGVLIEHHSVVAFVAAMHELFEMSDADRVLGYAAYTFDVSIFEMFSALLIGARLHVAPDADRLDTDRLQALLEQAEISVMDMPPAVMALLDPSRLRALRVAFVGGEAFPGELVNRWNRVARFFNGYGPTECTVTMIVQECAGEWESSPPIGLPIANHVAHVLDDNLRLMPYGLPGELVIGGAGLARGYLNQAELTEQKFVADPFGSAPDGRLYRTGDLVKRLRNGAIVFLGRVDRQVKIRGVRIEPGEVEAVLAGHAAVRQVLVDVWTNDRGQRYLVGYVAVGSGTGSESDQQPVSAQELRELAAAKLPAAMVPQYVLVLPELPLTTSGKIDMRALPSPDSVSPDQVVAFVEPRTETEQILATDLFAPMLRAERVDVVRNFFEAGGSSLQAAQVIAGIRRRFGVEVSVAEFFREPTVEGLAQVIDRAGTGSLDDDGLLDMIEQLSDEQAADMLDGELGKVR